MKRIALLSYFIFHISFVWSQYLLYGTTAGGGTYNMGTIFSYNPITNAQTVLFSFNGLDGSGPEGNFLVVSDTMLYATTTFGGIYNMGTVFSFNVKTKTERVLINFNGTNGYMSDGLNNLIQAKNGLIYGATFAGGADNAGVIFSYDIVTNKDSTLFNLDSSLTGAGSYEAFLQDTSTGYLYGVTKFGGMGLHTGVLFRFDPTNNKDTVLVNFDTTSTVQPVCELLKASNGLLYGITGGGGDSNLGIIFSYDIASNIFIDQFNFFWERGGGSNGNYLTQLSNGLIYGMTENGGTGDGGVLYSFNPVTDSEKVLVNFDYTNGGNPQGGLIQDPDNGLIYGMTGYGGGNSTGVFFSYDTATSTYTKKFDFTGSNGEYPLSGLTLVDTLISTGVHKINANWSVRVYPNPNNGSFALSLLNIKDRCGIEIYNVLGENIYKAIIHSDNTVINLNGQPQGIYFYRVIKEDGGLVGEGKMVIEN